MALSGRTFVRRKSSQNLATKSEPCLSHFKTCRLKTQNQIQQNNSRLNESPAESLCGPSKDGVRFMLFRECDVRGRKLLYDSAGQNNPDKKQFHILEDMVFGSAALSFHGDTYKLHDFSHEHWEGYHMMLTKIFQAQPVTLPPTATKDHQFCMGQVPGCTTDSGFMDEATESSKSESYSGERDSLLSSLSSFAVSSKASAASFSYESSTTLGIPRLGATEKAASDSMIPRRNGSKRKSRKLRLAIVILFGGKNSNTKCCEMNYRDLILHKFALVEVFLQQLQLQVLQGFFKGAQCITLLNDAFSDFQKNCANVWCNPGLRDPAWNALLPTNSDAAHQFVSGFISLALRYDTKLTQFFFSSILTAVLTCHVTWVYSFAQQALLPEECHNRIVLLTQDFNLAERFMFVLSYFIRCPYALQLYDDVIKSSNKVVPRQKKHSSSSMEIRNAAVVAEFNPLKPTCNINDNVAYNSGSPFDPSSSKEENGNNANRRHSQQTENARYLRDYFDARFAAEKNLIKEEDFGSFKNAIMRGSFQEFAGHGKVGEGRENSTSSSNSPNFFVGSVPEISVSNLQQACSTVADLPANKPKFVEIPLPAYPKTSELTNAEFHSHWSCGKTGSSNYVSGRTLQAFKPTSSNWLDDLRRDLCAVACLYGRASCVIADIDKCEIQILTHEVGSKFPLRLKEKWSPVSMSGAVSTLVESAQLIWDLTGNLRQCVDHIESKLKLLCRKSEELAQIVTSSVSTWNIERITSLLGVEAQDLPLLLAACSVHSPRIGQMVGLSLV